MVGACFGSYPATGSFSRTALKSKSGVRTPLAGIWTGIIVIVALYGLTPAFYWIPTAALSAIIIHAVGDLIASPAQVYSYWRVNPIEFVIWWAAVLVTVFSTIEDGIYTALISSVVLLFLRLAFPRSNFLGRITVYSNGDSSTSRDLYVPLKHNGIINPDIEVHSPTPGILIYRLEESFVYPNSSRVDSFLADYVRENMRRGVDLTDVKASDRAWNDPGPSGTNEEAQAENAAKPDLEAIVLDLAAVSVELN
jgi:sodium-independent sulfate anion transporter 11